MDENMIFRNKNRNYEDKWDRMLDNYAEMTASKMKTYDQFRQQQFREQQEDNGFTLIEEQKDEFYSTDRVKENVLMIDELMDHAEALQLTGAQKEDLNIRRNRIKDFELLNDKTKEDSDKMTRVKEEIRQYDVLLSMAPKSLEEYQTFCMLAKEKCEDVIQSCNEYLKRGKSLRFWRSDRNDRFHMVEEAKERFLKDQDIFSTLSELTDTEKFLRPDDTMLDLMNLEAINERLVAYDAAQRQEQEEDQLLEEELKRMEEELDDQEEGYKQAEGVNDLFTAEEKRLQREEKRQAGENQAENVGEFFAGAGEEYQEQKKEEEYEYEEGDSFEEIPAEEQEQYQEQKKEEEYEYEEGDSFEEIPAEEQEQYQKEHQEEAERQRQAEEERQRKEAEEREALDKQAEGVNALFAAAEKEQEEAEKAERKRQEEEARRAEQQKQQQQQQNEQQQQQEQVLKFGQRELDAMGQVDTPEIQNVRTAITNIQTKMAEQMPPITLNAEKKLDRKAEQAIRKNVLDEFCVNMVVLFARLYKSITECLNKENGAGYDNVEGLKEMLEHLRNQAKTDRSMFRERVVSYRAMLAENEAEAVKEHTWREAWKYVRAIDYDLDHNKDFVIKNGGAGASDILVIENKMTKEKVFFRKEEDAGGMNQEAFVDNYCNTVKENIKCDEEVKQALFEMFKKCADEGHLQGLFEELRGAGDGIKTIDALLEAPVLCTEAVKNYCQNASPELKQEMGKAVGLFARKLFQRSFSKDEAKIQPDQSLTARNVATSRMATLLGVGSMVSDSRTAVIEKDGKKIMGNVMEDTQGKSLSFNREKKYSYTDQAIAESFMLQIFDILCGQVDRHYGNFHIITNDQGEIEGLKALDNDMAFGALEGEDAIDHNGCQQIRPLSKYHFQALPEAFAKKILALNMDYVREALGDLLDEQAFKSMHHRLLYLQSHIKDYSGMKQNPETGNLEYQGEDKDDTLRMLKAVQSFKNSLVQYEDQNKVKYDFYKFDAINAYGEVKKQEEWTSEDRISLIRWDAVGDLQARIDARRAQLQQNNQPGNN